jgi:DNA-binding transcriptional MerR regulator
VEAASQALDGTSQPADLAEAPQIPDRLFFRIGDVSEVTGIEPYVLRFWESEFPNLAPKKGSNGQREYRRRDVEMVLEIKRLLYDEGYTIAGARKALKDKSRKKKREPRPRVQSALPGMAAPADGPSSEALGAIKKELQEILKLLGPA